MRWRLFAVVVLAVLSMTCGAGSVQVEDRPAPGEMGAAIEIGDLSR